jgi:hypothetical protein
VPASLVAGSAPQLLAELGRSGDHQGPQGVDGLAAGLDRGGPSHPQAAHHLHQVAAGLGNGGDLPGQHRSSSRLGIHRVRLAPPPAGGAVGPVDLQDQLALGTEEARQAGPIAAAALHPERLHLAKLAGPLQHGTVAGGRGGKVRKGQASTQLVDGTGHMEVAVGVDANDDPPGIGVCDGGDGRLPS